MPKYLELALQIPYSNSPERYFSFRLKRHLYNEPSEYERTNKILVISDIEGNFQAFQHLLIRSGVIDKKHQWTFGEGHLVIVGDCFDRGDKVTECLWLIYSLEENARKEGGYVHFILGNHEIMNLCGDWRYVHPKYANQVKQKKLTALYDGNNILWNWMLTKNMIERIGNLLFVHGGISPEINDCGLTISELNNKVRAHYINPMQTFSDPLLNLIFNSKKSPFWYRGYYQEAVNEDMVNTTLSRFGVQAIITGHTLTDKISTHFNRKVLNVNTGHSRGKSQALLIVDGVYYCVNRKGEKELL